MSEAPRQAQCPAVLLSVPSRGQGMNVKEEWTLRPCMTWLHPLTTCRITFHQMVHVDRHGIKAGGDIRTSSPPGIVSLKNEPDEMKSGGTISSADILSSVPENIVFSFSSSNGIWWFTDLLQDPRISQKLLFYSSSYEECLKT